MILNLAARRARGAKRSAVYVVLTLLLGASLSVIAGAVPSSAHSQLLDTTPEDGSSLDTAPEQVEFVFNEPVRLIDEGMRLFPAEGDPSTIDAWVHDSVVTAALPPNLPDSTYTVSYRIVSADGHPVSGAITFSVGDGTPIADVQAQTPALAGDDPNTARITNLFTALQFVGLLLFAGTLFFERIVLRSAHALHANHRILSWSFSAASTSSLLLIPFSALRVVGEPPLALLDIATWTPGVLWAPIISALTVTVAGGVALVLNRNATTVIARCALAVATVIALAAPALIGHTRTIQPAWLMISADVAHLVAGAFWLGGTVGLVRFLATAGPGIRGETPRVDPLLSTQVTLRFSRYALASVVLLAISGFLMTWLILDSWSQLLSSSYGRTLLLKLGIVLAIIGLAWWNRAKLLPAVSAHPQSSSQWFMLRKIVSYEAALLIAVLVITGVLTNTAPGHDHHESESSSQTEPVTLEAESQGLRIHGNLEPAFAGNNVFTFRLEYEGDRITIEEVEISARLPEQELGPLVSTPTVNETTGEYEALVTLPVAGDWTLQVTARIDSFSSPIVLLPVTIH